MIRFPRHHILGLLLLNAGLFLQLQGCSFPVRTGYDRQLGDYKPLASSTKHKAPIPPTKPAKKSKQASSNKRPTLQQAIQPWLGTPYRLGGQSRSGIDCSGFCQIILQETRGIQIPRTTQASWETGKSVSRHQLKPGDVIFFGNFWGINHSGIWLGNGRFVHASSSRGVTITTLDKDPYWKSRYQGARRY